jgi:HlyD family secretion protein
VVSAEAQVKSAQAALAQAQAQYEHQQADTSRTVALAQQGIMSTQARDEHGDSLQAAKAAVDAARDNLAAAQANLRQARAHELLTAGFGAHGGPDPRRRGQCPRAGESASVEEGYAQVFAHQRQGGRVGGAAGRSGDRGSAHCHHHGPDADLGLRAAARDAGRCVQLGDSLRVVMPSGDTVWGKVIAKSAEATLPRSAT